LLLLAGYVPDYLDKQNDKANYFNAGLILNNVTRDWLAYNE
jgi:hypothetical protein